MHHVTYVIHIINLFFLGGFGCFRYPTIFKLPWVALILTGRGLANESLTVVGSPGRVALK